MNTPSFNGEQAQSTGPRVLALIRPEKHEETRQLFAKVTEDLVLCATVDDFIAESSGTQYPVAILPIGVLPELQRARLITTLASMRRRPSIIVYSPTSGQLGWPGWIDSGDLIFVAKPFTEDRLRDAIAHAAADFEERSKRWQC